MSTRQILPVLILVNLVVFSHSLFSSGKYNDNDSPNSSCSNGRISLCHSQNADSAVTVQTPPNADYLFGGLEAIFLTDGSGMCIGANVGMRPFPHLGFNLSLALGSRETELADDNMLYFYGGIMVFLSRRLIFNPQIGIFTWSGQSCYGQDDPAPLNSYWSDFTCSFHILYKIMNHFYLNPSISFGGVTRVGLGVNLGY